MSVQLSDRAITFASVLCVVVGAMLFSFAEPLHPGSANASCGAEAPCPGEQVCCAEVCLAEGMLCCGGVGYNPEYEGCCDGIVYDLSTHCCE